MEKYVNKKKAILLLAVLSIYVVIITPLLIINLQNKQKLRGKAQTTTTTPTVSPAQSCGNVSTDTILILDSTGSMSEVENSTGRTKLDSAKIAAKSFVDKMSADSNNRIGLVTFSDTAHLNSVLTNNFSSLKSIIDSLSATGSSCHDCAVRVAKEEFGAHGRSGVKKVAIFLTDGIAINAEGNPNYVPASVGQAAVMTRVKEAYSSYGVIFYPVGFGDNVETDFLKGIANLTGGEYHFSPNGNDLQIIFNKISQIAGKGSITGFVFNDANSNATFDPNEPKLSNWNVQLVSSSGTLTFATDTTGTYLITNLCNGNYQLKEMLKPGWRQTVPSDPNGYSVTITNANSFTNKNFGNQIIPPTPTPTPKPTNTPTPIPTATPKPTATPIPTSTPQPTPGTTFLDLTVYEHGIWNSGDNTNPADTNLSNKNPVHTTIDAYLEIFNTNNQLIAEGSGQLTYNGTDGNFQGSIGIYPDEAYPDPLPSGKYYIKIRTPIHLKKLITNILTITAGQKNTIPAATLVTGDSNNDNKLNILDYNSLLDCYSDLTGAVACDVDKKVVTDFNDDASVNQTDYNLFLREISTQPGE